MRKKNVFLRQKVTVFDMENGWKIWILSKNIFGESLTKCAPSGHEKTIINRKSREPFFKYGSLRLNDLSWMIVFCWTVSFIVLCVFNNTLFEFVLPSFFQPFFLFTWVSNEGNDAQSESILPILKSGFYVFKASRLSSRKSKVFLGERVHLRVERSWSEKIKQSQIGREATMLHSS